MISTQFPVFIILIPLSLAVILPLLKQHRRLIQSVVGLTLGLMFLLALFNWFEIHSYGEYAYTFGGYASNLGIQFYIDELTSLLVLFILFLSVIIIFYSFADIPHELEKHQFGLYYSLILLLLFSMLGMVYTNDLFNLYVFMEILSITSTAIISIKHRKANFLASFRYLMLSSIGSITILFGLAFLYMVTGHLNMFEVHKVIQNVWTTYPMNLLLASGFILTGLGIKSAMFPLHVWLPDAHASAPSPSSAFLSALVVKVYIFAMYKILFRVLGTVMVKGLGIDQAILIFAALGMVFGSLFAIGQRDIKRMLAYSSVAQIGYIFLGLGLMSEQGLAASLFHIFSHGLMKTALFLSAGSIIFATGKRKLNALDGIGYRMPITMIVFSIAAFGMIGIPGVSGFMSKIYLGLALIEGQHPIYLALILLSSFLNAVYYLPIIIAAFLKEDPEHRHAMKMDPLPKRMWIPMVVLALCLIIIGFYPQLIMDIIEASLPAYLVG